MIYTCNPGNAEGIGKRIRNSRSSSSNSKCETSLVSETLSQKPKKLKIHKPRFLQRLPDPSPLPSLDVTSWFQHRASSYFEIQLTDWPSPRNQSELGSVPYPPVLRLASPSTADVLDQTMLSCEVGHPVHFEILSSISGLWVPDAGGIPQAC